MSSLFSRQRFLVVLLILGLLAAIPAAGDEKEPAADDKVAVVNGTAITRAELEQEFEKLRQQFSQQGQAIPDEQLGAMKKELLKSLIDSELLYQQSRKLDVKVSEGELAQQVAALKSRFPDQKAYESALSQMRMSEKDLESDLEKLLAIQQLLQKVIESDTTVSETESRQFYQDHPDYFKESAQVKASHILIKVDPNASEDEKAKARQEMESIRKEAVNGGDFAALAKAHSDCPSKENGGDLGYFGAGQMVAPFEKAAFAMEPDQVSDIVETRFGYHIIKVVDKKGAGVTEYAEVKDKIDHFLKQEKGKEKFDAYIQELRDGAKIETFL